jgi:hypothetical protein
MYAYIMHTYTHTHRRERLRAPSTLIFKLSRKDTKNYTRNEIAEKKILETEVEEDEETSPLPSLWWTEEASVLCPK